MKTADREPKSLGQNSQQPSTWRGSSAQILLNQVGCEARKTPADGGVFFLDFPFYRTLPVQKLLPAAHKRCLGPALYALIRICHAEYIEGMESAFEIIAEPNRRAILRLLAASQQSVGEIERQLGMPQPTVSKHLRMLREAGFVESTVDAQRRLYRLKPEPFQELDVWLAQFRQFWSACVDALERQLDRMNPATKIKTRSRRRDPDRERNKGETK